MITYDFLTKLQKALVATLAATESIIAGTHSQDTVNGLLPKQLKELETLSQEGLGSFKKGKKPSSQKTIFEAVIIDDDADELFRALYDTELGAWNAIFTWLVNNTSQPVLAPIHEWDVKQGGHFLLNQPFQGWKVAINPAIVNE